MLEEYKNNRTVWEENVDSANLRSNILVTNRIVNLLPNLKGKTVLDLGCGNGKLARRLAEKGAIVVGVYITPDQIQLAKEIEKERRQGIVYLEEDLMHLKKTQLPFETFDIVISAMTHLYLSVDSFAHSFSIIYSFLNREGHFIYGDVHPAREGNQVLEDGQRLQADLPTLNGKSFKTSFFFHSQKSLSHSIANAGFYIQKMYEPMPANSERDLYGKLFDSLGDVPPYIIIDAVRMI